MVGTNPSTRVWQYALCSGATGADVAELVAKCEQNNPNNPCGASTDDPAQCVFSTQALDSNNQPIPGTLATRNVCEYDLHVYVYLPGSVVLARDYSYTDADARESAEIVDTLNANCSAVRNDLNARLDEILDYVYLFSTHQPLNINLPNNGSHAPWPGDSEISATDATYHHFDVRTKVCNLSEAGCTDGVVTSELALFLAPYRKLHSQETAVNGTQSVLLYGALVPWSASSYIREAGTVTQRHVQTSPWIGGVQNVTQVTHPFYPGLIGRIVVTKGNELQVFTHGIGINRAFCSTPRPFRGINMVLGLINDLVGPVVFRTLDEELIKYHRGIPTGEPATFRDVIGAP